jgi:poly(3-hydroxybutyrate) depolymerase
MPTIGLGVSSRTGGEFHPGGRNLATRCPVQQDDRWLEFGTAAKRKRHIIDYGLYDATYLSMTPWRWTAAATEAVFGNPLNPLAYTVPGRMMRASADVFSSIVKRRGKPAWKIDATMDVVAERPFCRLVRFTQERDHAVPRLLLVAPLSGHFATLLRGTVAALVPEHDVYLTDWFDAREVPLSSGVFDLESYIEYVIDFTRLLGPDVHVMAVCQPAPVVLSAVALMAAHNDPAQPRSMILMGGPIDTRFHPTAPTKLSKQYALEWFERELTTTLPTYYPGAGRRVYPGFMQLGAFLSMNATRHIDAHIKMFNELVRGDGESADARRAFYDEYMSVMDVTAEYFLQTIDHVFQRHSLPLGTLTWRGERVDPAAITSTALFTVEGELDDISAPGQTLAAQDLVSSLRSTQRDHLLQPGVGHYGIFNGRRWRESIVPRIASFVRAHA